MSGAGISNLIAVAEDGFRLAVQVTGPMSGPAVLLLPGQANSHVWWDDLRTDFDDTFRTITFDYRGTGRSRGPVGDWTMASFAQDSAVVLERLGIGSAHVYGTSMGGRVAQMLAITRPDCVRSLVLACTSTGGPNAIARDPAVTQSIVTVRGAARRRVLHDLFFTPRRPPHLDDDRFLGDPSMTLEEEVAHTRASRRHDAWNALPALGCPTLVLHGGQDRMTPEPNGARLAARIRGAKYVVDQNGRHGFFAEAREWLVPRIKGFLEATY